jgi:hypothetical protein
LERSIRWMQTCCERADPKRSGEPRGRPSRRRAWLRDDMANEVKRLKTYGKTPPYPIITYITGRS